MIIVKDTNDSGSKESMDSQWCELFIEICKIVALDIPNQPLIRSKELSDFVYGTFEHFWKTKRYYDIDWLLLMSLGKVVKERISSGIQILSSNTGCISDRRASICALREENLISYNYRAEFAKNQC